MDINEYQKKALATAIYPNKGDNPYYPTMGLCGEAGEVADKVKKIMRGDYDKNDQERVLAIMYEVGDCLWYIANVASEFDFDLATIAEMNLHKLKIRMYEDKIKGDGDNR